MPITIYKLISVITDPFQGALWSDMRFYMVPFGSKTDADQHAPPEVSGQNGVRFKCDSVYITSVAAAAD